jgi:hypothetical protein
MKKYLPLLIGSAALCFLWLVNTEAASAHAGNPLRAVSIQAGRYPIEIRYYTEPRAGHILEFTIVPQLPITTSMRYKVSAVPGTFVDAVPVKAALEPDLDNPTGIAGRVNLPVQGQWLLSIEVEGPLGPAWGDAPILAQAPPAIPEWVGWLIGLLPFWAMLLFIGTRLREANSQESSTASSLESIRYRHD